MAATAAARVPRATRSDRFTWTIIESPMGPLLAVASPIGLCELEFDGVRRARTLAARLAERFPDLGGAPDSLVEAPARGGPLAPVRRWLHRYFAGDLPRGDELTLDLRGSEFERRVWAGLLTIPPGETRAYGELAAAIGSPGAARAVGLANSRNPIAIIVPCHRVIGADGSLTGYAGGMARKRTLLEHERAAVADARGEARQLGLWKN
jgi:methylated-DNA-[protein]-cysteine S-methyltransferase